MKRVQEIWEHPLYQQNLKELTQLEADRIFCRHTPEHFLDVARLAYIFSLERGISCPRELIYCTALLHDIGRAEQYTVGTPHDEAGARIAETILSDLDFSSEEKKRSSLRSASTVLPVMRFQCSASSSTKLTKIQELFFSVWQNQNATGPRRKNMTIQY